MSDDFIPLNQSTPVQNNRQNQWSQERNQHQRYPNNRSWNGQRRGGYNNRWGNSPRSSFGSNSSNNSMHDNKSNIDAYLHPSMLKDPWADLRKENQAVNT